MLRRRQPPVPRRNSIVASAAVMTHRPEALRRTQIRTEDWQNEAWTFYDSVGELRFGAGWLANGMSRVNLIAARAPEHLGDEPSEIIPPDPDDPHSTPLPPAEAAAVDLVRAIAGGPSGQGQVLSEVAVLLTIPGIAYLLMEPEMTLVEAPPDLAPILNGDNTDEYQPEPDESWLWQVLSSDELRTQGDNYEVQVGPGEWRKLHDDFVLVKVWHPHPRLSFLADSPCRSVLTVLTQISLLDAHVQATAQSRLAGAGLLVLPAEAEFVPLPIAGQGTTPAEVIPTASLEDTPRTEDDFVDVLVAAMTVPIGDRASAAAVVPLTVRIPGEFADKVKHITFWTEFSDAVLPLRQAAVERLALGLDMPPEALTGVADVNHWTAWQVQESAVTLHIEPMAETVVHAITQGYLRPGLVAQGFEEESDNLLVWYDTTDLTTRPDRSDDTIAAYDRYEASGSALRREAGLSEDDAPDEAELRHRILVAIALAQPQLTQQLLEAAGISTGPEEPAGGGPVAGPPAPEEPGTGPPPGPDPAPDEAPPVQASAMLEACDGLVTRALEKAGARLRDAAGKGRRGGAGTLPPDDPIALHVTLGGATAHAALDDLLNGAWFRVPTVAHRLGVDSEALTATLDSYVRGLLATGHAHDHDRLADALGLAAPVA